MTYECSRSKYIVFAFHGFFFFLETWGLYFLLNKQKKTFLDGHKDLL